MVSYKEKRIEKVYEKYKKLVTFVISKYIKDKEIIKDITLDVFLNYIENENKVFNIQKYLTSTAKYMSLKYLKKNNQMDLDSIDEEVLYSNNKSNIEYNLIIDEFKEFLSNEEIDIMILHIVYNYTFKEISLTKKIKLNSIKSIYRRAIIKCKEKGVFLND